MRVALLLFATLALLTSATAEECQMTTSDPEVFTCPAGVGFACWYVDNDLCQFECVFSIWFYEESNGIEGLQRGDEVVDDTCGGRYESDTIIS